MQRIRPLPSIGEQITEEDRGGKGAYSLESVTAISDTGVLITPVGLLNTNNFRSSEQHLLRCRVLRRFLHGSVGWARKTPFVWRPALFSNDVDGPPPVYVEMICFGDSRVKLGRQEGTNFRHGISARMSMVSDMRW